MIRLTNLTKRYGSFTAVNAINLEVPRGELFGFLGPNGAGKTTTLRMIAGILRPTSGSVRIGGIDIVAEGIRVARGEALTLSQADIGCHGHAFECRINAEDPTTFAPSPGQITRFDVPGGPGVRVDSHIAAGAAVPPYYDSMIAKLIVHGQTRREAMARLKVALSEMDGEPGFIEGGFDIHYLEQLLKAEASA